MGLLDKIFGSKNQKVLKKVQPLVNSINSLEEEYSLLNDTDLKNKRGEFINRHNNGESLDMLLPCLLYTSPSPRDVEESRMPSSA